MTESTMTYRRMGNTGLTLSALSLGGWTTFGGTLTDEALADTIIRTAYDAGVNFFDISDIYSRGGSERLMGKTLSTLPRHRLVISSKLYWPMSDDVNDRGLSRKHIMESIDKSLQRIGTDYLDIYFCHRFDADTPMEETARAMDDLIHRGKVLYWGTSEWSAAQIREMQALCRKLNLYPPVVEQPQLNLMAYRRYLEDVEPAVTENGLGVVTWSPLASGMLTGKYDEGIPEDSRLGKLEWLRTRMFAEEKIQLARELKPLAEQLGVSRTVLSIAWALRQPGVSSVITGATSPEQVKENLSALTVDIPDDLDGTLRKLFLPVQPDPES